MRSIEKMIPFIFCETAYNRNVNIQKIESIQSQNDLFIVRRCIYYANEISIRSSEKSSFDDMFSVIFDLASSLLFWFVWQKRTAFTNLWRLCGNE